MKGTVVENVVHDRSNFECTVAPVPSTLADILVFELLRTFSPTLHAVLSAAAAASSQRCCDAAQQQQQRRRRLYRLPSTSTNEAPRTRRAQTRPAITMRVPAIINRLLCKPIATSTRTIHAALPACGTDGSDGNCARIQRLGRQICTVYSRD